MKGTFELQQLLRWYPADWRRRYGEEFVALLDDELAGSSPTRRFRLKVAVSGVRERAVEVGVTGAGTSRSTQRRNGSLVVLLAWSIMVIGGASLVKTAEHSATAIPVATRSVAQWAYGTAAVAGAVGTAFVVVGALIVLPRFVRFVRAGGWSSVRRTFFQAFVATVVTAAATLGVSAWAHHLSSLQRNGGDRWYSGAFLGYALLVTLVIFFWTKTALVTVTRLDLTNRIVRWESWLALGVTASTIAVAAGAMTWWVQMRLHAPWFLQGTPVGVSASPWSAHLMVTAFIMLVAMSAALWGAWRVTLTYVPVHDETFVLGGRGGT